MAVANKLSKKDIKNKALYFLGRRDYGYKELFNKLLKYTDEYEQLKHIMDELVHYGYLSEQRFVASYLRSKSNKFGIAKLKYNLLNKQVDEDIIKNTILDMELDEYAIAKNVWLRKFGNYATDIKERGRQIRFLLNRGFSYEVVNKIVNNKH